jgi:hypothetical protein
MHQPYRSVGIVLCCLTAAAALVACGPDKTPSTTTAQPAQSPSTVDPSTGKITAPVQGDKVRQCAIITGTAQLAPGKSLVTAMQNLDNGDPKLYFEGVANWQVPAQLATWTSKQYFGSGDSSVGQRYAVALFSLDPASIKSGFDSHPKTWAEKAAPAGATMIARVEVKRIAGQGPPECQ